MCSTAPPQPTSRSSTVTSSPSRARSCPRHSASPSRPAALVRGLGAFVTADDGPGAVALLREGDADWFRYGHLEAVRAAVGVPPGTPGVAPAPMAPGDAVERLTRAMEVASASPHWPL